MRGGRHFRPQVHGATVRRFIATCTVVATVVGYLYGDSTGVNYKKAASNKSTPKSSTKLKDEHSEPRTGANANPYVVLGGLHLTLVYGLSS